jgi:APA family basic amino acid/polyamine antiporter
MVDPILVPPHGSGTPEPAFVVAAPTQDHPPELRRVLGLLPVTASGVGIIIGAGIYVLLAAATAEAGATVWLAFLLAGLVSALTALSYAELSAMFPTAGGEYAYARHALPPPLPFLVGWLMATGLVIGAAAVALGFGRYLQSFVAVDPRIGALGMLVAVTLIALRGIALAGRLVVALSLLQVGGLVAVIAIGLPHLGAVDLRRGPGPGGVLAGAALVFFAFIGFDEVTTLAEETRDPTTTIPRALLLALGLSTALYVGVALAAVSVLGPEALAASPRPLADVFAHVLSADAGRVVAAIALVTTTNTTLLCLTAASRVLYRMAADGVLPTPLAHVAPKSGAPDAAVIVGGVSALVVATFGVLTVVAGVTDAAVYVTFLSVQATVILLRRRQPDAPRPFRLPGTIGWVPVAPIVGFGLVVVLLAALPRSVLLLGGGVALLGLLLDLVRSRRARSR